MSRDVLDRASLAGHQRRKKGAVGCTAAQRVAAALQASGNLTGVSFLEEATAAKRFELLHEVAPNAVVIGLLVNPTVGTTEKDIKEALVAARVLGLERRVLNSSNLSQTDKAFAMMVH